MPADTTSLKFTFSKLYIEGICRAWFHSNYFVMRYLQEPFTKIHKLETASSKVDQVPKCFDLGCDHKCTGAR